jgi:DNA polymerase-3 subunit delta
MKLSPRDAGGYFAKPDASRTGLLIYGADAMRVALRRQQVVSALIGPKGDGDAEMRLTRIAAAELRKDPAALVDAIKSQGFFAGPRVVLVEDAGDGLAKTISAALADWKQGDAQVIVTSGWLTARSALRKDFESHPNAYAAGIFDDPPSRSEIEADLARAGLDDVTDDAMQDIVALSRTLGPGDFSQTLEKLSLYKIGDATPVSAEDVLACAPATTEVALDDVLNCVAEAREGEIGLIVRKLEGQGVLPVSLCIGATRHFRTLHAAAANTGGPALGMARARPPVFGARRDRMARQAQGWGLRKLEKALSMLTDTDLALRSASRAPAMAVMERTLIRLAMLRKL